MRKGKFLLAAVMALTACGSGGSGSNVTSADSTAAATTISEDITEMTEEPQTNVLNAVFGDIRTEYNTSLDLSDYPLTGSDTPADFSFTVEAESGKFSGNVKVQERKSASGEKFVTGLNVEGDRLDLPFTAEYSGFYDLNFMTTGSSGDRVNSVLLDDMKVGDITTLTTGNEFGDTILDNIYIEKGEHTVSLAPEWGYIDIDCMTITAAKAPITDDVYKVTKPLSNPNADEPTKRLYKFLCVIQCHFPVLRIECQIIDCVVYIKPHAFCNEPVNQAHFDRVAVLHELMPGSNSVLAAISVIRQKLRKIQVRRDRKVAAFQRFFAKRRRQLSVK